MSTPSETEVKSPGKELDFDAVVVKSPEPTEVTEKDETAAEIENKIDELIESVQEAVEKDKNKDSEKLEEDTTEPMETDAPIIVQPEDVAVEEQPEPKDSQDDPVLSSVDEDALEDTQSMSEGTKSPKGSLSIGAKSDENLLSEENLDRESPEIWPEKIPGVQDFVQEHTSNASGAEGTSPPTWTKGLTQDDIDQMHELGAMTDSQLILEIKKLYDHAYKLGIEEAKEMSRGKILQIFLNTKKK